MEWGLLGLFAAAFITYAAMRLAEPIALRWGLVDRPQGRKDHDAPTPVTGGVCMLLAVALAMPLFGNLTPAFPAFCLAGLILVVTGLLDDRYDLNWRWRILAQVLAALVMIYGGDLRVQYVGHLVALGPLSVPFTVFATVGVINAVNMADGSDGLAGSVVAAALALLIAAALYSGNVPLAQRLLVLVGAVLGFLAMNLRLPWQPRARAFMGNSGSALLGFIVAWVSFRLTHTNGHPVSGILPPWLLAPPLIDCVCLMLRRVRQGRSPFSADRGHMHHLLRDAGFSPTAIALGLAALTVAMGGAAALAFLLKVPELVLVLLFLALLLAYYVFSADRARAVARLRRVRGLLVPAAPPPAEAAVEQVP